MDGGAVRIKKVCKSKGRVSKQSSVYINNKFMVVNFVMAVIGEGCRWREN